MSRPNYRVVLSFDGERKLYSARIPELPQCSAEGATRGEAITRVEEELDAVLHGFTERGARPPSALDDTDRELSGELSVKVSTTLHRELLWQAHNEGVELSQLLAELLAAALEGRRHGRGGPRRHGGHNNHDNIGNSIGNENPRGRGEFSERGRGNHAARFHDMLEDRAAFVDYVRKLESDGGRPRGDGRPGSFGEGRPRHEGRPYGDNRGHGPQGGHGDHGQGHGRGGRRPGREGHRGGPQRRGPEGREPQTGGNPGPAAPRPQGPGDSES